jgi:uncharacterized protein (DUF2249 family)
MISMDNRQSLDLDVRSLVPRERHSLIFAKLAALEQGQSLRLTNDHDPKPLYYQLQAEQPDAFEWSPEEMGPEQWVVRITKQGVDAPAQTDHGSGAPRQ